MGAGILTLRELGRATLERQLLLRRVAKPALETVRHLVGMQAQVPSNPYVGLWSRLDGFRPEEVSQLVVDRKVVRIVVMRGTLHLVTAEDCLVLRPLAQPVLEGEMARHRDFAPSLRTVDLDAVMAFARPLLTERPHSGPQLRAAMAERFPDEDAAALAFACRNRLALVQIPPRGVWRRSAQVVYTTAEAWLGAPVAADPSPDDVVMRYFAAFGPASVADVGTWSRWTGLREVVERLRPRLRTFRDERGRELFDVPDGPRPGPDVPAPVRFLPEYDNVLLSHGDRSRFVSEEYGRRLQAAGGPVKGTVLVDGLVGGTWSIDVDKAAGRATLVVRHISPLPAEMAADLADEADRLVRFVEPDASDHDVRLVAVD